MAIYRHIIETPGLSELFADPMVRAVMVRDGVTLEETRRLIDDMRRRLHRPDTAVASVVPQPRAGVRPFCWPATTRR